MPSLSPHTETHCASLPSIECVTFSCSPLSSQEIHSAPQQLQPLTLHPHPSKGPSRSLISLERFILVCPFISFLLGLWFTVVASLSLCSTSYMFVLTAPRFPSLKSPPSCVSFKAVGKIPLSERPLPGAVQPWPPRNTTGILLLTLALSTGRTFSLDQTSLGSSQPLACFSISCALSEGKLCALHSAGGNMTFFTCFLSAPSQRPLQPSTTFSGTDISTAAKFCSSFFFFYPPGFCDLFITQFVSPH